MAHVIDWQRRNILKGGAATAAFAIGKLSAARAASAPTVRIAAPLELSGSAAGFGVVFYNAAKLTVDEINRAGGIKSLGGAKLELVVQDNRSDLQRALEALDQAADKEGVVATIGPTTSAAAIAASLKCEQIGLPYLSSAQVNDAIAKSGRQYFFRLAASVNTYVDGVVDFIKAVEQKTGVLHKKVGIVSLDVEPGTIVNARFQELCRSNGWTFVTESYDYRTTKDFTPMVARLRSQGVDLVIGQQYPLDSVLFAKAAQQLDYNPIAFVWALGGQYLNSFTASVGKAAEFVIDNSFVAPAAANPATRQLNQLYLERFKEPLTGYAGFAPAIIAVIADAVERAASTDRRKVRDAIAATNLAEGTAYMTIPGGVKFDDMNSNVVAHGAIIQIVDGQQHVIWPPEKAERSPVWPRPAWAKF